MGKGSRPKKHPMSAGQREPNGRKQRETTRAARLVVERCEPTPELVRQIQHRGPTCYIQRAVMAEHLTAEQGQAVEAFAAIRRKLGLAERNPMPVEGRQQPRAPGREFDPEADFRATRTYLAACDGLDRVPGAFDAITDLCDQHMPRDLEALKAGARVLEGFFVRGVRAA